MAKNYRVISVKELRNDYVSLHKVCLIGHFNLLIRSALNAGLRSETRSKDSYLRSERKRHEMN